jgi:hypothetical protein
MKGKMSKEYHPLWRSTARPRGSERSFRRIAEVVASREVNAVNDEDGKTKEDDKC